MVASCIETSRSSFIALPFRSYLHLLIELAEEEVSMTAGSTSKCNEEPEVLQKFFFRIRDRSRARREVKLNLSLRDRPALRQALHSGGCG